MDPTLLARTSGSLKLQRAADQISVRFSERCSVVQILDGELTHNDSTDSTGQIGVFRPRGRLLFSPESQIFIEGELRGTGQFERFSRDHLLFQTRNRRQPDIKILYSCTVKKTMP